MIEKVWKWCINHAILKKNDKILIACSGGPDSLALVSFFLKCRERLNLQLAVGHLEHGFRGAESTADAVFVREFCFDHDLKYYQRSADVPAYCQQHHLSQEDGARIVRYQFLRETAQLLGGAKIAVGHHLNDQAETVLIHLLRGAGGSGLAGMQPMSNGIIRPFLGVTRQEIEDYCQTEQLMPRIDKTNFEKNYLRNRIRLDLLPKLSSEYNPSIIAALCRTAAIVGAEHQFIAAQTAPLFGSVAVETAEGWCFDRRAVNSLHIALRRELFRQSFEKKFGSLKGISFFHVEKMIELSINGTSGTELELPDGFRFYCSYEKLQLRRLPQYQGGKANKHSTVRQMADNMVELRLGQQNEFMNQKITLEIMEQAEKANNPNEIVFDFDKIKFPLLVRSRKNGDMFQPMGMRGHKKLKDFFIDAKIEREKRDSLLLICDQQEILWIAGVRQSENAKLTAHTKRFLRIRISDNHK